MHPRLEIDRTKVGACLAKRISVNGNWQSTRISLDSQRAVLRLLFGVSRAGGLALAKRYCDRKNDHEFCYASAPHDISLSPSSLNQLLIVAPSRVSGGESHQQQLTRYRTTRASQARAPRLEVLVTA
jgi:hypothetical protein